MTGDFAFRVVGVVCFSFWVLRALCFQFCYILLESGQALLNVFQNEHDLLEFDGDLGSDGLRGGR